MENKTLSEIFLEKLNKNSEEAGRLFACLFEIMDEETLANILKEAYSGRKKAYWFTAFHKQFRQIDVFSHCYRLDPDAKITPAEEKELAELQTYWLKCSSEIHKWDDAELAKLPKNQESKTYIKKAAEFRIKRDIQWEKKFPLAKKKRMWHLKDLKNERKKVSINGLLNSAVWCAVWTDPKNVLHDTLEDTFEKFLRQKRRNKRLAV